MKQKPKLSKRIDYPIVVFIQMNRINKILSDESMGWKNMKRLERALNALESIVKAKKEKLEKSVSDKLETKNSMIKGISNEPKHIDKILDALMEKYDLLNELINSIGLFGEYAPEPDTYGSEQYEGV